MRCLSCVIVCVGLLGSIVGCSGVKDGAGREEAVAEIERLGGTVGYDEKKVGRPIVWVSFHHVAVDDDGLRCVEGLSDLRGLDLCHSNVTDAGLIRLKGLKLLRELELTDTAITDAGLAELKGLQNLDTLVLAATIVSDEGLVHLRELPKLDGLVLVSTNVGDGGIVHLKALKSLSMTALFLLKNIVEVIR